MRVWVKNLCQRLTFQFGISCAFSGFNEAFSHTAYFQDLHVAHGPSPAHVAPCRVPMSLIFRTHRRFDEKTLARTGCEPRAWDAGRPEAELLA